MIDDKGIKWIGTDGGLVTIDGNTWNVFKSTNSDLPYNDVSTIKIDNQNIKWIGTSGGGLARFNDVEWKVFNTSNSPLPTGDVRSFAIDGDGNKWIGTYFGGLAMYRESSVGIHDLIKLKTSKISAVLEQNYPNPFNETTTIDFLLEAPSQVVLEVFSIGGEKICTVANEKKSPGKYSVPFNANDLPAGIYYYRLQTETGTSVRKMTLIK